MQSNLASSAQSLLYIASNFDDFGSVTNFYNDYNSSVFTVSDWDYLHDFLIDYYDASFSDFVSESDATNLTFQQYMDLNFFQRVTVAL